MSLHDEANMMDGTAFGFKPYISYETARRFVEEELGYKVTGILGRPEGQEDELRLDVEFLMSEWNIVRKLPDKYDQIISHVDPGREA